MTRSQRNESNNIKKGHQLWPESVTLAAKGKWVTRLLWVVIMTNSCYHLWIFFMSLNLICQDFFDGTVEAVTGASKYLCDSFLHFSFLSLVHLMFFYWKLLFWIKTGYKYHVFLIATNIIFQLYYYANIFNLLCYFFIIKKV